jgi:hypothetical protein
VGASKKDINNLKLKNERRNLSLKIPAFAKRVTLHKIDSLRFFARVYDGVIKVLLSILPPLRSRSALNARHSRKLANAVALHVPFYIRSARAKKPNLSASRSRLIISVKCAVVGFHIHARFSLSAEERRRRAGQTPNV